MIQRLNEWIRQLTTDPIGFIFSMLYTIVVVLISLILHECAHGYIAYRCGDPTAKMLGRLSLDPRRHLDPLGTLSMFILGVGWAKPVPVNPRYFRNVRRDDFLVSIAGITVNFTLFLLCTALSVFINRLMVGPDMYATFGTTAEGRESLYWTASNYVLNGSPLSAMPAWFQFPALHFVQRFLVMMSLTNLGLAVFNFLPIPPLDGYHIFNDLLLRGRFHLTRQAFQITQIVLLVICLSGALNGLLSKLEMSLWRTVVRLFTLL